MDNNQNKSHVLHISKSGRILILMVRFFAVILFICLKIVVVDAINNSLTIKPTKVIDTSDKNITDIKVESTKIDDTLDKVNDIYFRNKDIVGYIKINGTNIDYPIMYTGNDYYLHRNTDKEYSTAGTPYIDKRNILNPRDTNILIYGHNMKNGTIFHDLLNYEDSNYYNEHKYVYIYTLTEKHKYIITNVFKSKIYNTDDKVFKFYKFYNANNESEFNNYVANINALSLYNTGETLSYGDELITLVTCEYSTENGRMVVVAKRVE